METPIKLKEALKLHLKKYRYRYKMTVVEGTKQILDLLKEGFVPNVIFISEKADSYYGDVAAFGDIRIKKISKEKMDRICDTENNQGIAGIFPFEIPAETEKPVSDEVLMLYETQDPANFGNMVRTALWFGISDLYLYHSVDPFNPKTVRGSAGNVFKMNFHSVVDSSEFLRNSKEYGKYSITGEGKKTLKRFTPGEKNIYIFGNEGRGLPKEIKNLCTGSIRIEGGERVESLSLQTAFAIFSHWIYGGKK